MSALRHHFIPEYVVSVVQTDVANSRATVLPSAAALVNQNVEIPTRQRGDVHPRCRVGILRFLKMRFAVQSPRTFL